MGERNLPDQNSELLEKITRLLWGNGNVKQSILWRLAELEKAVSGLKLALERNRSTNRAVGCGIVVALLANALAGLLN